MKKLKEKAGFTLVELVVVIAALAILAGIAVPSYSGYIRKAQEAADLQLLDSMNTAFAAACAAHGIDPREIGNYGVWLESKDGKTVTGLGYWSDEYRELGEDFMAYFGANAGMPFRYLNVGDIAFQGGVFTGDGNSTAVRLARSMEELVGLLQKPDGAAADELEELIEKAEEDPALGEALGGFLEFLPLEEETEPLDLGKAALQYIAQDLAGSGIDEEAPKSLLGEFLTILRGQIANGDLDNISITQVAKFLTQLSGGKVSALSIMGLGYAMVSGFYSSDYYQGPPPVMGTQLSGILAYVTPAIQDENFERYLDEQGRSDMVGFLELMKSIAP